MSTPEPLNPAQWQAVHHKNGPLLILAGAGSGKTRVITFRLAELLKQGVSAQRLLVVTFTNKAAAELRHRVEQLLHGSPSQDPHLPRLELPRWIGTFHSIGARLLRSLSSYAGLPSSFPILDEDEQLKVCKELLIEEQIDAGRIDPQLLSVFRGVVQTYPWLVMALAGLHRLEELRHDYWNPLFGSVSAIEVSFLSEPAARTLMTAPTPDFPLDYDTKAMARIYELTHGQPYLIQLICHSLVSRYNRLLSEEPVPPLRRFLLTDVEAVVAQADLFTDGLRYFQGVWDHAVRSKPPGQAAVLSALAPQKDGLCFDELFPICGLSQQDLQAALRALVRHAVLVADDGRYRFTVELLRRWVTGQSGQLHNRNSATGKTN